MTLFDLAVITIVGLSVLLSVIRGLVREVLALAAWLVAFFAAPSDSPDAEGAAELSCLWVMHAPSLVVK